MKTLLTVLFCLSAVTFARADFTSYTLVSQSDPLTYAPVLSFTFDTLTINMTGNAPFGQPNVTTDLRNGAVMALSFTDTTSFVGDSVELLWLFPTATTVFQAFASVPVPGTTIAGHGSVDFTITGNTVTIGGETEGWSAGAFNGFEIIDLTLQSRGPSVPDSSSTLLLVGAAWVGLVFCGLKFSRS
jgi:hypothetical protein